MKISKKVLTMALCCFIALGASKIGVLKVDAESQPAKEVWRQPISVKLRAKWNYFYKSWWTINLVYREDGKVTLEGSTDIPDNLTFDDRYVLGWHPGSERRFSPRVLTNFGPTTSGLAKYTIKCAMDKFNEKKFRVGDVLFIHGRNWDNTVRFPHTKSNRWNVDTRVWNTITRNDYEYGYKNRDRWIAGLKITKDYGLVECNLPHQNV